MAPFLSRCLALDAAAVEMPRPDSHLLARPPCCHWAMDVDATVSVYYAAAAPSVSPLTWWCVRAMVIPLSRRVALDVLSVDIRLSTGRQCTCFVASVLSCCWWSVDVDAAVSVQRAAAAVRRVFLFDDSDCSE